MITPVIQTSFTSGEWAPSLYDRSDLAKYSTATRIMLNVFPHPHGPASSRGGTEFIGETKFSSKISRLIRFQFSVVQSYALEFGDQYMRVYKDRSRVLESDVTITGATAADPVVITAASHGYSDGDWVYISGIVGMTEVNNKYYVVSNKDANTFELTDVDGNDIDGSAFTAYSSGGTCEKVYEVGGLAANKTITGATAANPVVVTSAAHGYVDGDIIEISAVVGMTELNGNTYRVLNSDTNTFELEGIDGSGYTAYTSGGVANKVIFPYAEADLALLKYTQSADVLYITHPSYAIRKISRTGHTAWTVETIPYESSIDAPTSFARSAGSGSGHTYVVTAISTNGTESVVSNSATGGASDTFTWTAPADADYYVVYELINGMYGYIGTAGSNTYTMPSTLPTADMTDAPPTAYAPFIGADKYPGVCAFFEQRFITARTNDAPQDFFGSVIGDFENMNKATPLKDDDSYNFTLNAGEVNEIRWIVPMTDLVIGTSGAEWRIKSGSDTNSITPTSIDAKVQSRWGVSHIFPIVIGNSIIFIERSNKVVRDLHYSLEVDGYEGSDLSILSNHLFEGRTIVDWCYQQHPASIIWAIRSDGYLLGLTYHREHEVWGWHRHNTQGKFESIISISTAASVHDVYLICKRIINGSVRRYVEVLRDRLPVYSDGTVDVKDAFIVDCGLSLDAPVTITGATAADPVVITAVAHGFSDGDTVDICRVVGMTELNNNRYLVANKSTDTFELTTVDGDDVDGTAYTAYIEGGEVRKAVTTINGADHLEGASVSILADGNVIDPTIISSGSVVLANKASRVHLGLGYTQDLETMDFYGKTETGIMQDKLRNVNSVIIKMENTRALWVGPDADNLDEIAFRTDEDYGDPTALFTGDKEVNVDPGDGRSGRLFIRNTDPLPFTISAIIPRVEYGDE